MESVVRERPLDPAGGTATLNPGEHGIVSDANLGYVGRPKFRICVDERSRAVKEPYDLDLSGAEHQGRLVVQVVDY